MDSKLSLKIRKESRLRDQLQNRVHRLNDNIQKNMDKVRRMKEQEQMRTLKLKQFYKMHDTYLYLLSFFKIDDKKYVNFIRIENSENFLSVSLQSCSISCISDDFKLTEQSPLAHSQAFLSKIAGLISGATT